MRTVYPIGTTLYQPGRCFNGYTIIFGGLDVTLLDMNGRTVNRWRLDTDLHTHGTDRAHLLTSGHVLVSRGGMVSTDGVIDEYDWNGDLVWRYIPEGQIPHERLLGPHHDVWRKENGNTLICESAGRRVFEVTPKCETVWEYVGCGSRSYRYAYDHCPQTAELGYPNEIPVTPPAELRIPPDAAL